MGYVPSTTQTFVVDVPCSGAVEAEVHISIIVDIIFAKDKSEKLKILSKKSCLNANVGRFVAMNNLPQFANSSSIFYIAVCCAVLLICVLAILITLYYVKNTKSRTTESGGSAPTTTTTTFLAALPRNSVNASSYGSFRRMPSYSLLDDRSKDLQERITELTIQRYFA